ncbi:MAG TPA: helix-turn-helix transcriptional regulator [Jatrophihabitans sp.]|uniref:helix-turn-helix transcriptional regulator n=1 Tax=Jatrophihabitans sp. TaxID=1932789 RepID=UPI002EF52CAE
MPTSPEAGQATRVRSPAALGRAIRAARSQAGLTQAELAERARANRYAIVQLEAGHETRAIEILFDTLAALDLELSVRPRSG